MFSIFLFSQLLKPIFGSAGRDEDCGLQDLDWTESGGKRNFWPLQNFWPVTVYHLFCFTE